MQEVNRIAVGGFKDDQTIQFKALDRFNVHDSRDGFKNTVLEIKEFPTTEKVSD